MSERTLLLERLQMVLAALERIPRRFAKIETPDDFVTSQTGIDLMDSICMVAYSQTSPKNDLSLAHHQTRATISI